MYGLENCLAQIKGMMKVYSREYDRIENNRTTKTLQVETKKSSANWSTAKKVE